MNSASPSGDDCLPTPLFTEHDLGFLAVLMFGLVVTPFLPPVVPATAAAGYPVHACARVGEAAPASPAADRPEAAPPPGLASPARAQSVSSREPSP